MGAHSQSESRKSAARTLAHAAAICAAHLLLVFSLGAQSLPETVGRIEGDDLAIKGQVSLLREAGRSAAELVSGAEVTVRDGLARITLADGGEMDICGPAQFTVLKSGGSITLALSLGRVHVRLGSKPALVIYTALLVAEPLSVSGAPRDAVVGVEPDGSIGIHAARGAVRLEQQLTGQSLVVPQSSEVLLAGGQLDALREARGACRCEPVFARAAPPAPTPVQAGVVASSAGDDAKPEPAKKELPKPAVEEPTWTVLMPPLTFDANKPPPALQPRAETMLLVREVRVQPAVIYYGRVEKAATIKAATPVEIVNAETAPAEVKKSGGGFGAKLRNFFRRLFGGKPKN